MVFIAFINIYIVFIYSEFENETNKSLSTNRMHQKPQT